MGKKQAYSYETKLKAIELKLAQVPVKEIMERLHIKSNTQIYTWMEWYRNGEQQRLKQPLGKQYTYGKGPIDLENNEVTQLKLQNEYLKLQLQFLKKHIASERK